MTITQHAKLIELAESPVYAAKLLRKLDENKRMQDQLWDVYCIAVLTVGYCGLPSPA